MIFLIVFGLIVLIVATVAYVLFLVMKDDDEH